MEIRSPGPAAPWKPNNKAANRPSPPRKPEVRRAPPSVSPESRISGGSTELQVQDTRPFHIKKSNLPNKVPSITPSESFSKVTEFHPASIGWSNLPARERSLTSLLLANRQIHESVKHR